MSVVPFRIKGDPILEAVAEAVTDFGITSPIHGIAQDLVDTAANGSPGLKALGLAAPQIGYGVRMILVGHDVFVNPVVAKSEGVSVMEERCFSEPGKKFKIRRAKRVVVEYQDLAGATKRIKAQGGTAHVFLHEIDHLDGILMSKRARQTLMSGAVPV